MNRALIMGQEAVVINEIKSGFVPYVTMCLKTPRKVLPAHTNTIVAKSPKIPPARMRAKRPIPANCAIIPKQNPSPKLSTILNGDRRMKLLALIKATGQSIALSARTNSGIVKMIC